MLEEVSFMKFFMQMTWFLMNDSMEGIQRKFANCKVSLENQQSQYKFEVEWF